MAEWLMRLLIAEYLLIALAYAWQLDWWRADGTCWVNLGDSYAGSQKGMGVDGKAYGGSKQRTNVGSIGLPVPPDIPGLKSKDLVGIPWSVALVCDSFVGSGTTGIVALKLGRAFLGLELQPAYVEMSRKRIGAVIPLFA